MRSRLKLGVGGLVALAVVAVVAVAVAAVGGWAAMDSVIHATSGADFCGSCHTMQPMVDAYRQDVHGGKNVTGFAAECTSCHLPHDGSVRYLIAKAETGFHDVWAQLTYDLDEIDWLAKRGERERYVYDSGCLQCHSRLEEATSSDPKAFVAHKPYLLGQVDKTCVSCHEAVGHSDLQAALMKGTPTTGEARQ